MPRRQLEPTEDEKTSKYLKLLVWFSVANYLGDPRPSEAPIAAYARALGYAREGELRNAVKQNDSSVGEKRVLAHRKLFAKFGVNLTAPTAVLKDRMIEAFKGMEAGLSEDYQRRLMNMYRDPSLDWAWRVNSA